MGWAMQSGWPVGPSKHAKGQACYQLNVGQTSGLFSVSGLVMSKHWAATRLSMFGMEDLIARRVRLDLCNPGWRRQVKRQSYRFTAYKPVHFRVFSVFRGRTASFVARCIYTIFLVSYSTQKLVPQHRLTLAQTKGATE